MKLYVRNVVLPNICKMLFVIGYIAVVFMWMLPQMDIQHSNADAFAIMISVLFGLYVMDEATVNQIKIELKIT